MAKVELFQIDGLVAPAPSPALADLFAILARLSRHPIARRLNYSVSRQLWELHRVLHNQPSAILELLTEFYYEVGDFIPAPCEVLVLVRAAWQSWDDMAGLGLAVDYEHEPALPPPPKPYGWKCRVLTPRQLDEDDDDDDDDDWCR